MESNKSKLNEQQILSELDNVFNEKTAVDFSNGHEITYNFFPYYSDFYFYLAATKIHLYSGENKWAIVFEKIGYDFGGFRVASNLYYFGNFSKQVSTIKTVKYVSNDKIVVHLDDREISSLITEKDEDHLEFIRNKHSDSIQINGRSLKIEDDTQKYEASGIKLELNSKGYKVIQIHDLLRYFYATYPETLFVSENQILEPLDPGMKKLMSIKNFNYPVKLEFDEIKPSETELFRLLAKVIVSNNTTLYIPKETANSYWQFWEKYRI